ncbi:uroporphyrinogen-III synthase [Roseibium aestuarii]|uniref:Uroporphyrinogen-III synthase n=1 Tax=Roseibium aestuarii TaxID=2600299 RepID=A0ABW4JUV4_9HYPH|nr:uroporphyrinogen-III synthase [Roseibium aestuarii]
MRFLVTRPDPEGTATAERLRALGHEVLCAPVMREDRLALPDGLDPRGWTTLAVTSARVAVILASLPVFENLRMLPAYAVGDRTAEALRATGFQTVRSASGAGADLAALIADAQPGARVVYPAAQDRAFDLSGALQALGVTCDTFDLYRMVPADALAPDILDALRAGQVDRILLYSRRTAEIFVDLLKQASALELLRNQHVVALSETVAAALPNFARVEVARQPTEVSLFEAAGA